MDRSVVKVENLSKEYRFGVIGHGTFYKELQGWWARLRGKEDPNSKVSIHGGPALTGERFWALKDISFDIKQGEVFGIIGRNGAGKSTLLKILSRVTTPTEGCFKVRGRIASLLETGTGFHPELTGRENVYLNGMLHGMTKTEIKNKFDEIVDFSGIERFIDTPVKRYSSGMKVRLGFAVAAHLRPEILIVDEVLAVGDVEFRRKCLGKMQDVSEGGRTVLFVSHNMPAIRKLCHHGIVLESGEIVHRGPIAVVVNEYLASSSSDQIVNNDIPIRMHMNDNPDLEIYRIEIMDTDGQVIPSPKTKQDFCFKMFCKFNKSGNYSISISLRDANGLKIASISDEKKSCWLTGNRKNISTLTVKLNNVLLVGRYSISILVKDKHENKIDYIRHVFFDILSPSLGISTQNHSGVVHIGSKWNDPVML